MMPEGESPLLLPANQHKQLVVIDFEYANANVPGLEFANHFVRPSLITFDEFSIAEHLTNAYRLSGATTIMTPITPGLVRTTTTQHPKSNIDSFVHT
jgi:hypothetical protein